MSPDASHDDHYTLEPEAPAPSLPGRVIVRGDEEDLHHALGSDLMVHAQNCVRQFGDFHLALSGGSTPMPFYRRLMVDPTFREFPWKRTHLWLVDERRVPVTDERSNWAHIASILLDHSDIPRAHAHAIDATAVDADTRYEKELQATLAWREKGHDRLDFVLLGVGDDCHTASLFPHSPALSERDRLVVINAGETVTPPDRVTLTYKTINAARVIAVLITGAKKREAVARIVAGGEPEELPIAGVRPTSPDGSAGEMRWYLDRAACPAGG
ncbi:MAG: 6-phosphogluconolactonase [Phycisphaeraceae bacterium]|nr:6-phosphogluconolactonase [Phycisphaerales bacterium]MCB9842759.1 6-phosphogluconolactonase [Phycisphaeraceae bacterium]